MAENKFQVVLSAKLSKSSLTTIQEQLNNISAKVKFNIPIDTKQIDSLNKMANGMENVGEKSKRAVQHLQTFDDKVSKFLEWEIIGDVINTIEHAIGSAVEVIFDFDSVLTELTKVTDLAGDSLKKFQQDAFDVASQISSTGQAVLEASVIFAQAGYEANEALDLAKWATVLTNVSEAGATAEESASTLIATMKAFGLEAQDAGHIVDVLNEISNNYAVSVTNLSTAIKKSSASLAAGNNTLEEAMALNAAGIEILQESGRVANGLSTITARLTAKNDEYIKSITKGEGVLDSRTGDLRSTYDILKDLSVAWETLSGVEKQELTEVVAGKTQRSLFTALMSNFDTAVGAARDALNSENSAMEENSKRADSLQGKLNALNNSWQKFATTLDSDVVKGLIDTANGLVQIGTAIGGISTALPLLLSLISALSGAKLLAPLILTFKNLKVEINAVKTGMKEIDKSKAFDAASKSAVQLAGSITSVISGIGLLVSAVVSLKSIWDSYWQSRRDQIEKEIQSNVDSLNSLEDIKERYQEVIFSQDDEATKQKELHDLQTKLNEAVKNNNLKIYQDDIDGTIKKLDELTQRQEAQLKLDLYKTFEQGVSELVTKDTFKKVSDIFASIPIIGFGSNIIEAFHDVTTGITGYTSAIESAGIEVGIGLTSRLDAINQAIEFYTEKNNIALDNGRADLAETFSESIKILQKAKEDILNTVPRIITSNRINLEKP